MSQTVQQTCAAPPAQPATGESVLRFIVLTGVLCLIGLTRNPLDYFLEAYDYTYYQARFAYLKGSVADRHSIVAAMADGTISRHEYTHQVFPAFMRALPVQAQELFPVTERAKESTSCVPNSRTSSRTKKKRPAGPGERGGD